MSSINYSGKSIVVTGAYSGIGAALVPLLQAFGAEQITVLDVRRPTYEVAQFIEVDLGDPDSIDAALPLLPSRIDVLFNNAGIPGTRPVEQVMGVNLFAVQRLSRALLPRIPQGGSIVNTASIAGIGWPANLSEILSLLQLDDWQEQLAWLREKSELVGNGYNFSKECLQVYTMLLGRSAWCTRGVRVNSVCPSPVDTPILADFRATMTDAAIDQAIREGGGQLCTPRQQAQVLAFLGSELASYVNAININVDGGYGAGLMLGEVRIPPLSD
ncbi:SDR family oxidoreductase [Pseudomonas sp. BN414]|uniref:coniferyl-alcohol dehydrogenase n=1 Tax=unclassified Pseudomonas TaxID=196821 RepID=UPI002458EE77|nr:MULTISPECIES: coniferyl-alcohol dehydrogenase [unclassified Pseudomonas]MDH4565458.1 SDR family oxidoreductase [Pseudomonas sp. BN414]MDH4874476.1 SDR family oxidoreductase [Pseudomonas sp. BN515]